MPKFLEAKLKAEYPNDPAAPFKIMNSIGAMRGSKETAKRARIQAKHDRDEAAGTARDEHWSGK